jgi:hypothetical protein
VGPKCVQNVGPKMKNYIITFCSLICQFLVFKLWDPNASNSIIPWAEPKTTPTRGVPHYVMALLFTLKSILLQKKNYGNSNIFHHAKISSLKKSSKRNQNPS